MLRDRQELDMAEAHMLKIGDEPVAGLVPTAHPAPFGPEPGADMDLVDGERFRHRVRTVAPFQPSGIAPAEIRRSGDDRARSWRLLVPAAERVSLPGQLFAIL